MVSIGRIITGFVIVWIALYVVACYWFIAAPSVEIQQIKVDKFHLPVEPVSRQMHEANNQSQLLSDIFLSAECSTMIDAAIDFSFKHQSVSVIVVSHNENELDLVTTILSILRNSGGFLLQVVIVDDASLRKISAWPIWTSNNEIRSAFRDEKLLIIRSENRLGVSGAKAHGANFALTGRKSNPPETLVFSDAHIVVSNNWLKPLLVTLSRQPHAIVYPAIDVLVDENVLRGLDSQHEIGLIRSENVIGAFDWALNFKWEFITQTSKERVAVLKSGVIPGPDDEVLSPAAPGILAMRSDFYTAVGGFDRSLGLWGQDSVELSIRVWLCGGLVIRQPCSRVAHKYKHTFHDAAVGHGVMQQIVDRNVMMTADKWLAPADREVVYQARFTGRVPYAVELPADSRYSKDNMHVKMLTSEFCQSFQWYLQEVYPGLLLDKAAVTAAYSDHLASGYLEKSLSGLLKQYNSPSHLVHDPVEVALLLDKATKGDEVSIQQRHDAFIPPVVKYVHPDNYRVGAKYVPVTNFRAQEEEEEAVVDPHEKHASHVRDTLACEDEVQLDGSMPCSVRLTFKNACVVNKSYMMFGCPKSCGLCGSDGKLCVDFYENKCKEWKAAGKCEREEAEMSHICRASCNKCTVVPTTPDAVVAPAPAAAGADAVVKPVAPVGGAGAEDPALITVAEVNPYTAQEQYKAGALPDPVAPGNSACDLNHRPHGELLAMMKIAPPRDQQNQQTYQPQRIFCGIYTMAKNHESNVKATKEVWAKKCDGFVAFSTEDDPTIPALAIKHEGKEEYDNMWQKSRSIWKYIAQHYANQFDFFLMGGDDMFYVVDNLRAYLGSPPIVFLQSEKKGLFLGRRFYPPGQQLFNSGGAGYLLDTAALEILAANLDTPKCFPHQHGFWEDVNIANCLRVSAGITPLDTRDNQQRERFHPFTPGQHLTYRIPKTNPDWYPKYNPWLKEGMDCCSDESISFHYVPGDLMRQLNSYLLHCDNKVQSNEHGKLE